MILEIGRICLKIAGRETGRYCVIVGKEEGDFVMVSGPKAITGVKRRRCNILHLEPLQHRFEIDSKTDDAKLEEIWKKSGLIEKLGIKVPVKRTKNKEKL